MNENSFTPEEQKEFERIANIEIDKWESEYNKEIEELGYPKWIITSFLRLRRLSESLSKNRFRKTNLEIANEIREILKAYPDSLFAYDQRCLAKRDRALQELLEALKKKECDEQNVS